MFFPVNNKLDGNVGSHWSLLVYASDKKHRGFYYHDPIGRANLQHATELMERMSKPNVWKNFTCTASKEETSGLR